MVFSPLGDVCVNADLNDLVSQYFFRGYPYKDLIAILNVVHGYQISIRTLHRILRTNNLYRVGHKSNSSLVIDFIEKEIAEAGSSLGYRQIHQRCIKAGYRVARHNVSQIIKALDPEGVESRRRNRLRRRSYHSPGPNWVWHLDGYDKLKPYGLSIHGCVDGFSRRILWIKVSESNKNPQSICKYFTDYIQNIGGVPRKVVGDRGTENIYVAAAQRFLRREDNDSMAGQKSFQYGRSISNQRIEALWSWLRRMCTGWWISFFKDMIDSGDFDNTDPIQIDCLKFVFGPLLRKDISDFKENWNSHYIRRNALTDGERRPHGRPDLLYFNASRDFKFNYDEEDLNICVEELCSNEYKNPYFCSDEFQELAFILMNENNLNFATNCENGKELYNTLLNLIQIIH